MLDAYWENMCTVIKAKNPSILLQLEHKYKRSAFKWALDLYGVSDAYELGMNADIIIISAYHPPFCGEWPRACGWCPSCPCAHPRAHLCSLWPCANWPPHSIWPVLTCWSPTYGYSQLRAPLSTAPCGSEIPTTGVCLQRDELTCPATRVPAWMHTYAFFSETVLNAFLLFADALSRLIFLIVVKIILLCLSVPSLCLLQVTIVDLESIFLRLSVDCVAVRLHAGWLLVSEKSKWSVSCWAMTGIGWEDWWYSSDVKKSSMVWIRLRESLY